MQLIESAMCSIYSTKMPIKQTWTPYTQNCLNQTVLHRLHTKIGELIKWERNKKARIRHCNCRLDLIHEKLNLPDCSFSLLNSDHSKLRSLYDAILFISYCYQSILDEIFFCVSPLRSIFGVFPLIVFDFFYPQCVYIYNAAWIGFLSSNLDNNWCLLVDSLVRHPNARFVRFAWATLIHAHKFADNWLNIFLVTV